jgi:hypothetical protein
MSRALDVLETVQLAIRCRDARDTVRTFLGDRYDLRIAPARSALRDLALQRGEPVLRIAIGAAKARADEGDGMGALAILAAAIDEVEDTSRYNGPAGGR